MNIKKLDILFENCDSLTIDGGNVRLLIAEGNSALNLCINKTADTEFREFGFSEPRYITTVFKRIQRRDIVRLVVFEKCAPIFADNLDNIKSNAEECCMETILDIDYHAESQYLGAPNSLQSCSLSRDGDLRVTFKRTSGEEEICGNIL